MKSLRDTHSYLWKCLLSITRLYEEYNVEELLDSDANILQQLPGMDQYKFYALLTSNDVGVAVLYPDHRTIAVLVYPVQIPSNSQDSEDSENDEDLTSYESDSDEEITPYDSDESESDQSF